MDIFTIIIENSISFLTGITAIILVFYTGETYRLRKEAQRQTENIFTPYLTLNSLEGQVYLKNLGKGIAKDIVFSPDIRIDEKFIANISAVGPGQENPLYILNKEENGFWSVGYRYVPDNISFVYWDTLGNKYRATFLKLSQYQEGFAEMKQGRSK